MSETSSDDYSEALCGSPPSEGHPNPPAQHTPLQSSSRGSASTASSLARDSVSDTVSTPEPIIQPTLRAEGPPGSTAEFSKLLGKAKQAWGDNKIPPNNTTTTTTTLPENEAKRIIQRARCAEAIPSAPELELATGYGAKIYGELLQEKREVHRLKEEKDRLFGAGRRAERELQLEERKVRVLLDAQGCEEGSRKVPKAARMRVRSACAALGVSEEARRTACRDRLSNIMRDLKATAEATKSIKSKRQYAHYEKLQETAASLDREKTELRARLEQKTRTETAEANRIETHSLLQRAHETEVVTDSLKKEARQVQEVVRQLQADVVRGRQRAESQRECQDRLAAKVSETRHLFEAKRGGLPEMEARLKHRLEELSVHTMQQCRTLERVKQECDEHIEQQRALLLRRSGLAEKLRSEYADGETELQQQQHKVDDARKALQGEARTDDDTIEQRMRTSHLGDAVAQRQAWQDEKLRLQQHLDDILSETSACKEKTDDDTEAHQRRLSSLRSAAQKRQDALLTQLQKQSVPERPASSPPAPRDPMAPLTEAVEGEEGGEGELRGPVFTAPTSPSAMTLPQQADSEEIAMLSSSMTDVEGEGGSQTSPT